MGKVFLFGIDGAVPELIFEKWRDELPNIKRLMDLGAYAKLNSTIPPTTIIAWNAMLSGKDPSEIGVYSYTFKDKKGSTKIVSSKNVKCKRIWDILTAQDKRTISLFVPLTYPVVPLKGIMVSDFLTPEIDDKCVYPIELKDELKKLGNEELLFDVAVGLAGHKSLPEGELIKRTLEMTRMQHQFAKKLLINEKWDLFLLINIGSDRLQHMLWRHFDETHRRHIKDSLFKHAIKEYYKYLDKQLGEFIDKLDENTTIIVASDHGMIKQEGKININNWLIEKGYLVLKKEYLDEIKGKKVRLSQENIDKEKTIAWGGGAYNARIYINKEKVGKEYGTFREKLIRELKSIPGSGGEKLDTKVYKAEEIYKDTSHQECPDLTIYFDDLRWASNPDLGQEGLYSWETAIGADSAGHSRQGCFIIYKKGMTKKGKIQDIEITQVMPTLLNILGIEKPKDIEVTKIEGI